MSQVSAVEDQVVRILCTAAYLPRITGITPYKTFCFDDLFIHESFLAIRGGPTSSISAIHISSLLAIIQAHVHMHPDTQAALQATPYLQQILVMTQLHHAGIHVSTSQAPIFENPTHYTYNFCRLGLLSSIPGFLVPLTAQFNFAREVLAINPALPLTEIQHLRDSFRYMDLDLGRHFVIFFENTFSPPSRPLSALPSPFGHIGTLSQHLPTVSLSPHNSSMLFPNFSNEESPVGQPAVISNTAQFVDMFMINSATSSNLLPDIGQLNPHSTPSTPPTQSINAVPMSAIFQAFNLDLNHKQQRYNVNGSRSILQQVRIFRKLSNLLITFGLPQFRDDLKGRGSCVSPDGLKITTTEILSALGWSHITYQKKAAAFYWAESVHQFQWKILPSPDNLLYRYWCGIVALFQPTGFIDQDIEPVKNAARFEEACAALITQNILLNKRKQIQSYLV